MPSSIRPRSPSNASSASVSRPASAATAQPSGAPAGSSAGSQQRRDPAPHAQPHAPSKRPANEQQQQAVLAAVHTLETADDVLELAPQAPFAGMRADHDGHVDPLVRGTRGVDGATGAGATIGQALFGNDSVKVTPFGLHIGDTSASGNDASLLLDRQSALVTGTFATGNDQSVSLTGGMLASVGYLGASYHDAHGNSLGGFGVLTTGGTPGMGFSAAHTGAHGSVALSPSGIADKTESSTVEAIQTAAEANDQVTVKTVRNKSGLMQLVVSAGHHGLAVVARVAGELRSTKSYTETLSPEEAKERIQYNGLVGRRAKGLNLAGTGTKLPRISEPNTFSPGAKMEQDVQSTLSMSLGLSAGGVHVMGGQIKSKKTVAKVTRGVPTAADPTPATQVQLVKQRMTNRLFAFDFPLLLSGVLNRTSMNQQTIEYLIDDDKLEDLQDLLLRRTNVLGKKAHFEASDGFNPAGIETPYDVRRTLQSLQQNNEAIAKFSAETIDGGHGWRMSVLPLPSSLFGPIAGLAYQQETNLRTGYVRGDDQVNMVARGTQHRKQYELPGVGSVAMEVELLKARSLFPGGTSLTSDILKYKDTFSHAGANTLQNVDKLLRAMVPSKLKDVEPPAADTKMSLAMDLEVEVQVVITPEIARNVALNSRFLRSAGLVPATTAAKALQEAYYVRSLAAIQRTLRSLQRDEIRGLIQALDRAGALVQLETRTKAFDVAQKKASKLQVKFGALGASANQNRKSLFKKVLGPAAAAAQDVQQMWRLAHSSPLIFAPAAKQQERKASLRDAGKGLAQLVAGEQSPLMLATMAKQAPKKNRSQLKTLLASEALQSPSADADADAATNTFAAEFAATLPQG